jgi:hypothetical protein
VGQSRVFIEGAFPRPALEGRAVMDGLPLASGVPALEGHFGVLASLVDVFFDKEVSLTEKICGKVKRHRIYSAQITNFIDNMQIRRTLAAPIPTPA